jgi:hypothetical protein
MSHQLIEIQYFGCICFYVEAIKNKYLILEQCETYQKMSFRNRCQILGPDKVINLTVPLVGGRDQKALISEVCIDNSQAWQTQQWRTLESCYNKSPFFLHYRDGLHALLFKKYETLWELNEATLHWVFSKLKVSAEVGYTSKFEKQPPGDCIDLRNQFLPSSRKSFGLTAYQQVFERPFETNLSILDLLFNLGPQSKGYLSANQVNVHVLPK